MRVVILGCGSSSGVPQVGGPDGGGNWGVCDPNEERNRRTRSSIVIEGSSSERLLVDTPPDLHAQLLACRIPRIDAILFTHAHADHITGLDEVRILNRIAGKPLPLYATAPTLAELRRRFDYAFRPWQGPGFFRPVFDVHTVLPGQTIHVGGLDVDLFDQDHGFVHTLGLRVGGFGYSTDVRSLDQAAFATLAGVETWVVSCFQRPEEHPSHAGLGTVLGWVRRLSPRLAVLTHMGLDMDWGWLIQHLPDGVEPGHDGLVLDLPNPKGDTP